MDVLTVAQRSKCMRAVKSANTKPEIAVRSICHRLGHRFRLGRKDLPGTPDLVFPRYNLCMFVHGCFWHRHTGCKFAYVPRSNAEFWEKKFSANVVRDSTVVMALLSQGWRVEVVWECELKRPELLEKRISSFFEL